MKTKLSNNQFHELSRYWFDLSKLTFASLFLKFFEPESLSLDGGFVGVLIWGLMLTIVFAILGMGFLKKD